MKPLGCGPVAGFLLLGLAFLFWLAEVATLSDLGSSDAAGNAMAQGFGELEAIVVWILLGVLVLLASVMRALPPAAALPGVLLLPLSGVAAMNAADLLRDTEAAPGLWPLSVPALVPPLVALLFVWAMVPARLRALPPVWLVPALVWGGTAALCVALLPMQAVRQQQIDAFHAAYRKWGEDFAKLPKDAPLWQRTPFLDTLDGSRRGEVIDSIQALPRRQDDAETMLTRGDFPLRYLSEFDLRPTASLCDKTRVLLRSRAAALSAGPDALQQVSDAIAAMRWLTGYGCSCDAESLAWENAAARIKDDGWDLHELRDLRDPAALGATIRDGPAHFDMLTAQSRLMGWLKFADDKTLRTQALAGARALPDRTEQAVDIFSHGSEFNAWDLLIVLPELDLQATPELCATALREVRRELTLIYRPTADNPQPYRDLEERFGTGRPLQALIWLAGHGCDVGDEMAQARSLVAAYGDSPERTAILAALSAR